MPKLPRFRTRGQSVPTAQGGEQPWNVRYDTGGEMIAQEAQQGAQLLGKVNREMINAKRQSNVASTKAKATELNSIAQDKINNMDPEEIGKFDPETNSVRLNEQTEQVINGLDEAIPDGLGEEEAQQMIEGYKARLRATARSTLRKKEASKIRAEGETAVNTFLKNGKMNSALEQIDTMDEAGALEEGEEVRMKEKVAPKAEFYLAQQAIKNGVSVKDIKKNPETLGTFAPAGEGWEEHLDEGELSMGSEEWSDLQRIQDKIVEQREEQRAEIQQQTADEMWKAYLDGDLTIGHVEEAFDNDRISRDFEKEMRGILQERKKTEKKDMNPESFSKELDLKMDIQGIDYNSNQSIRDSKDKVVSYYRQTGDLTEARQMFSDIVQEQQRQAEVQEFTDHQKQVLDFTKDEIEEVWSEAQQKGKPKEFQYVKTTKPADQIGEGDIEKYRKKIEKTGFGAGISGPGFDPWKNVAMTRQERGALLDALHHHVKNNPDESRSETMKWVEEQLQPHKARMAKMSLINRLEEETGLILSREGRQERQLQERVHDTTGYEDMSDENLKQILDIQD